MTAFFDVKLLFATPQSFHDSSPQVAPFMPLLEERGTACGGVVAFLFV